MFKKNRYSHLLYARGYLITDFYIKPPKANWKYKTIRNYHVYHDPEVKFEIVDNGFHWIALLGYALDTFSWSMDARFICNKLLEKYSYSNEKFFDYLDYLNGRFLLMYGDNYNAYILTDAGGLRSTFYSTNEYKLIVSSHQNLVGHYLNSSPLDPKEIDYYYNYTTYSLPGDLTTYKNVFFLIPNHYLNLKTREVKRYFPRETLKPNRLDEVIEDLSETLTKQFYLISNYNKLVFSLSAGFDSRTSLALVKEIKDDILFFTYYTDLAKGNKSSIIHNIDKEVVKSIVQNLELNHVFFPISIVEDNEDFNEFCAVLRHNVCGKHSYKLAKLYYEKLNDNVLHIRSNLSEIARAYYKKSLQLPKKISAKFMTECYSKRASKDPKIVSLFNNFYKKYHYDDLFNYDPYDLFYWEYRMGTWHTRVLLESDIAHDTFIVYNSRNVLNKMLSLSLTERKNDVIFQELINKNWPVLNYWNINSTKTVYDTVHLLKNRISFSQSREKQLEKEFINIGYDITNAIVTTGSKVDKKRKIPLDLFRLQKKMRFFMDISNPKKGDFVKFEQKFETNPGDGYLLSIQLRSPYENRNYKGRLVYSVSLNDQLLLLEDVCMWKDTNFINIKWKSQEKIEKLEILVEAIKDCEKWSWGKAARLFIERIDFRKIDFNGSLSVTASSPYSKVYNFESPIKRITNKFLNK